MGAAAAAARGEWGGSVRGGRGESARPRPKSELGELGDGGMAAGGAGAGHEHAARARGGRGA
jgi:hypothetical protein